MFTCAANSLVWLQGLTSSAGATEREVSSRARRRDAETCKVDAPTRLQARCGCFDAMLIGAIRILSRNAIFFYIVFIKKLIIKILQNKEYEKEKYKPGAKK